MLKIQTGMSRPPNEVVHSEQRALIGKYAAENVSTRAAKYFYS